MSRGGRHRARRFRRNLAVIARRLCGFARHPGLEPWDVIVRGRITLLSERCRWCGTLRVEGLLSDPA